MRVPGGRTFGIFDTEEAMVSEVKRFYREGHSFTEIGRRVGISRTTVQRVLGLRRDVPYHNERTPLPSNGNGTGKSPKVYRLKRDYEQEIGQDLRSLREKLDSLWFIPEGGNGG